MKKKLIALGVLLSIASVNASAAVPAEYGHCEFEAREAALALGKLNAHAFVDTTKLLSHEGEGHSIRYETFEVVIATKKSRDNNLTVNVKTAENDDPLLCSVESIQTVIYH